MDNALRILAVVAILITAAFLLWPKDHTMPVHVGEAEIGLLKDPVTKDCSPHRGFLSQDGKHCVLHGILLPGWHEVDPDQYEVEMIPTETITIEIR